MPRSTHETSRDPAARATHSDRADDRDDVVTDEGLGLSPRGAPTGRAEVIDEESDLTTTPHSLDETDTSPVDADVEPSLMDQELLTDPIAAVGDPDDSADPVADGDAVYVPPMDPVVGAGRHGDVTVLGGFSPSAEEEIRPRRSASDGQIGDEAIVDAVQSALLHDAATSDLAIEVTVEQGIVYLRGTVSGPEDAEAAEEVASRVEGVNDVIEELEVATI